MKPILQVRVLRFSILQEIEGAWAAKDFAALLEEMDFGDLGGMSDGELREMCILSLQDLKPEAAAALVLKQHLGGRLKEGQIRNLASEMLDEKLWEQYADMSLHEGMFNVGSLLYAAFPRSFPEPDAVQVTVNVNAANDAAKQILAGPPHESFLVRLLADGMKDDATLHRLFDKQLDGKSFPEADTIVWIVRSEPSNGGTTQIEVISSGYWLDALRDAKSYESLAYPDGVQRIGAG